MPIPKLDAGLSDDYAVVSPHYSYEGPRFSIYYGYEVLRADAPADDDEQTCDDWAGAVMWNGKPFVIPPHLFGADPADVGKSWMDLVAWLLSTGALTLDADALRAALANA